MKANLKRNPKAPMAQEVREQAIPKTAPTLSKDQRIDLLQQSHGEIVDLVEGFEIKAIPVLLLLREVLEDEGGPKDLFLRTQREGLPYAHASDAVGEICDWLATELHECWNKVDASRMAVSKPNPKFQD